MHLIIPTQTCVHHIAAEQIIRVEALGTYSKLYLAGGSTLVVSKVLTWCQEHLPEPMFARVHRSHLVNKTYVVNMTSGEYKTIQLTNGDVVAVSRRSTAYATKVMKTLQVCSSISEVKTAY